MVSEATCPRCGHATNAYDPEETSGLGVLCVQCWLDHGEEQDGPVFIVVRRDQA